jgi:uncharacterized membrane protein (UPF0127 family)
MYFRSSKIAGEIVAHHIDCGGRFKLLNRKPRQGFDETELNYQNTCLLINCPAMKIIRITLFLCLQILFHPAWSDGVALDLIPAYKMQIPATLKDGNFVTLPFANRLILAQIANTPQSREHGLMQRDNLCEDCGMLFVFEQPDKVSFWMKDTLLPLSIAFIDAEGNIVNIDEMQPNTTDIHNSLGNVLFALEMNKGWFARNNVVPAKQVISAKTLPNAP